MQKVKSIKQKLYLGSHHKMERFAVLFLAVSIGLILTTFAAFQKMQARNAQSLSDDAILTQQFRFSRSGVSGTVEGVYVNEDKTRAFLMLRLENTNTISTDAKNYKMYYSAYKSTRRNTPAGAIYMFGNTGYMGLYFTDTAGFVSQVSDITVWNTQDLVGLPPVDPNDSQMDHFDDMKVYANFGAKNAVHLEVLDQEGALDISELFAQTVAETELLDITKELNETLTQMELSLLRMSEYKARLERNSVVLLNDPEEIRGDQILRESGTEGEDDVLSASFVSNMPGGYDFTWQGRHVSDGFLELVLSEGEDLRTLMNKMTNDRRGSVASLDTNQEWFYEDGSVAYTPNQSEVLITDKEQSVVNDIKALIQEWQQYYNLREKYQVNLLPKLLILDENTRSQNTGFSVYSGDDVISVW